MAKLNVHGNEMFDDVCESLNVPLLRVGSFVIAFGEEDEKELNNLLERGRANGVPGLEIISGERAREMEPKLSDDVTAALWAPTAGITLSLIHIWYHHRDPAGSGDDPRGPEERCCWC